MKLDLLRARFALLSVTLATALTCAASQLSTTPAAAAPVSSPFPAPPNTFTRPGIFVPAKAPSHLTISDIAIVEGGAGLVFKGQAESECPVQPGQQLVIQSGGRIIGTATLRGGAAHESIPFQATLDSKPTGPLTLGFKTGLKTSYGTTKLNAAEITRFHTGLGPSPSATPTWPGGGVHTEILILPPCN